MAFGEGFSHVDSKAALEVGNYEAEIISAEVKNGNYGSYIQGTVSINGNKEIYPNVFLLNDSPKQGYGSYTVEQALHIWNANMTKFFNNFNIPEGDFNPSHWIGKKGTITVQVQKKKPEYKEIVMWKKEPYVPEVKKDEPATDKKEDFPEDIPF